MSRLPRGAHYGLILSYARLQQRNCNRAKPPGSTWQFTITADHWICLVEGTCSFYLLSPRMPTINIEGSFLLQLSILIALQSLLQAHHFDTRGTISARLCTFTIRASSLLCFPGLASTQKGREILCLRLAVIVLGKNGNNCSPLRSKQKSATLFRAAKTDPRVPFNSALSALLLKPQIAYAWHNEDWNDEDNYRVLQFKGNRPNGR
jgi:hypothetical protein